MSLELDIKTILISYAQLTLFAMMLSIGLSEGFANLALLLRQRNLLIRCLLAAFVVSPIAAIVINQIVPLSFPARVGLLAMAICPGAPMIYRKTLKGKASPHLAGSFQVTMALLCVLFVPLWIAILAKLYPAEFAIEPATIFRQIASVQLIPIAVGLAIRQWLPDFAEDINEPVFKLSSFLLLGIFVVILVVALPKVLTAGIPTIFAAVLFAGACVAAGHFLGGSTPERRLTIAIANSTRNAGLSLAIATANFEDPGILGAIATYAAVSAVVGGIYANKYQKKMAAEAN
ncbi:MAG: bile acid:sodium symporter family protein [Spirulina sp.]